MPVCEQHKNMEEDIKDIKKVLYGNGRPGLIERVSRFDTKMTIIMWLNGIMATAMIASVIKPIIGG